MTLREQMLFLGFILFVVIVLSLSMPSVVPYRKDTLFSKEFRYEGFSDAESNVPVKQQQQNESFEVKFKTEGFEGLQSSPLNSSEKLDIFSDFQGSSTCASYGLGNSKGYLCLDDKATKLLLTRGGNASGNPSQIG
jgi:hypothetical protein